MEPKINTEMENKSDAEISIVRMFFVVEWILENQYSVIPFRIIVSPQKDRYEENDEVQARWGRGKSVYPARIVKTSDDQDLLSEELTSIIEVELRKKNEAAGKKQTVPDSSNILRPFQTEDNNYVPETCTQKEVSVVKKTKPKENTGVKKSSKKQKEDLEKAASNLELIELALEKSSFGLKTPQKSTKETTPSVLATPSPVISTSCLQESPTSVRRSPRIVKNTLHSLSSPYNRPSTSSDTSTVLNSAFRVLNSRDLEMEDTSTPTRQSDVNIQQRVAAIESWLLNLQQEVNQHRSYINWLYNEQQKQSLSLNSAAKETLVTPGNHQGQRFSHNASTTSEPVMVPNDHQCNESETAEHSFTKDHLRNLISHETNFSKGAKVLFKKLYSTEEIVGRSLTGQKANSTKTAKPAIENQAKLAMLYEIVMEKWPYATKPMINGKLADLLKPSATRN